MLVDCMWITLLPHKTSLLVPCMLMSISTLIYPGKSHVSRLYNLVNSQPILDCNISNSRLKHPKSENDKFKPVSEIISFFKFKKLSYFEEKAGRLVFIFS